MWQQENKPKPVPKLRSRQRHTPALWFSAAVCTLKQQTSIPARAWSSPGAVTLGASAGYCTLCRGRTGGRRELSATFSNKYTQPPWRFLGFEGKANWLYKGEETKGLQGSFPTEKHESITLALVTFLLNCFPFPLILNGTTCRMPCIFSILTYFGINRVFKPNV